MMKIDDISKSDFQTLRDCYDGPAKLLDELDNPVQTPPPVNPRYWHNKLDDAQQMGFIDGFNAANDPSRIPLTLFVGMIVGFLAGFFSFYKG